MLDRKRTFPVGKGVRIPITVEFYNKKSKYGDEVGRKWTSSNSKQAIKESPAYCCFSLY